MTHPLVGVIRRYVEDYTNGHDVAVVPDIIDRGYRFVMSGQTLDYDSYVAMVAGAFDHFPDLELVVHDLLTDGERLAMRFTEHSSSPRHEGRRAAWTGISLYRWNGVDALTECLVEQDFTGRREQFAAGVAAPIEPAMADPWSTSPVAADGGAEAVVRGWLGDLHLGSSPAAARDGIVPAGAPPIEVDGLDVDDLFSAGAKVAFRITWHGKYRGGLPGIPDDRLGRACTLTATGIAHVDEGAVAKAWLVTDRHGLRLRLR